MTPALQESLVQDLLAATVSVPGQQLATVVDAYHCALGLEIIWRGELQSELSRAWGIDDRQRSVVILAPPGDPHGAIRLVSGESPAPPALATFGWSVMEISVRDVDGLFERVRRSAAFRINGEPHDLVFSDAPPGQRAMQAVGPAGEQLYLTQILHQTPGRELAVPPDGAEVGGVFIAVLAARKYAGVKAFYADVLGMDPYLEVENGLSFVARTVGWPAAQNGRLLALRPRGVTRIEVDEYPPIAARRVQPAGDLPPGFGLATLSVTDVDRVLDVVRAAGHPPISDPVHLDAPPYLGRRAFTVRGADGELVELVGP